VEREPSKKGSGIVSQLTGLFILAPMLLFAPVQCPANREPRRIREEPPAEAVYHSALHLREQGYHQAEQETLRYLISRYPQSRWAAQAREELEDTP
jgi:hypothetical protein